MSRASHGKTSPDVLPCSLQYAKKKASGGRLMPEGQRGDARPRSQSAGGGRSGRRVGDDAELFGPRRVGKTGGRRRHHSLERAAAGRCGAIREGMAAV